MWRNLAILALVTVCGVLLFLMGSAAWRLIRSFLQNARRGREP
jgi:hypothetical protein